MQHIQRSLQKMSFFRWILLLWIGFAYLWGVLWGRGLQEQANPSFFFLFTFFVLVHFSLYGIGSFLQTTSQWSRLLYVAIQALLIMLISLVTHRLPISLGLYLALFAELASMLFKVPMTLLVGAASLLLLSFSLSLQLFYGWNDVLIDFTHIVLPYILPICLLMVGYALLLTRQTREHAQTQALLRELECTHRQLADASARIEALTRVAERQRLARELHDTLAQGLAGLILQLEAVKSHLRDHHSQRALEIVTQAIERARISLAAARSAIDDLRTEVLPPADLQLALEDEIARFTAATGIPCTTDLSSLSLAPDAFYESIVRVVAEGLLNVARHAQACQVWVCIAEKDQILDIEVRDDGIGFDPTALNEQGHYGLLGLRERTRLLGGQFTLTSAPGKGTSLRFLLPAKGRGDTV